MKTKLYTKYTMILYAYIKFNAKSMLQTHENNTLKTYTYITNKHVNEHTRCVCILKVNAVKFQNIYL